MNCVVTDGKVTQLPATNDSIFMLALRLLLVQIHSFNLTSEFLNIPVHLEGGGRRGKEEGKSPAVSSVTAFMFGICSGEFSHIHQHHTHTDTGTMFMPRAAQIQESFLSDASSFHSIRGNALLTITTF